MIVISAGPGRIGAGRDAAEPRELGDRSPGATALLNTCWVALLQPRRLGGGLLLHRRQPHRAPRRRDRWRGRPFLDEHLLVAEIDLRDADRLRWRLPLLDRRALRHRGPVA